MFLQEKLKKLIMWMGGRCENQLTEETTHLISKTVFSDKYIVCCYTKFLYKIFQKQNEIYDFFTESCYFWLSYHEK